MNKIKKKIAALSEYLGGDSRAQVLLQSIEKDVNDQRHELNDTKELLDRAREQGINDANRLAECNSRLANGSSELSSLRSEVGRLQRQHHSVQDENEKLKMLLAAYESDFDSPERTEIAKANGLNLPVDSKYVIDIQSFTNAFNKLKKEMKFCPPSEWGSFELFDIIKNFSESEMIKLGRFVSCLACLPLFPNSVPPPVTTSHGIIQNIKNRQVVSEATIAKFTHWFRANVLFTPLERKVYSATDTYGESDRDSNRKLSTRKSTT